MGKSWFRGLVWPNLGYAAVFPVLGLTIAFVLVRAPVSAATSTLAMVAGRVVSVAQTSFKMETSPLGPFCRPPLMCPDFIAASREYVVDFGSGTVFAGNYLGTITPSAVTVGSEVVVYGPLIPFVLSDGTPSTKQPQIMWPLPQLVGTITAHGVYLLSPQMWPCWSPLAVPRCLPMVNPGGPEQGLNGSGGGPPLPVW